MNKIEAEHSSNICSRAILLNIQRFSQQGSVSFTFYNTTTVHILV